ncbi:MAG: ADP-glyceromanno-heptose 6-epimerase [Elusimicrobia bacterium]|nr:ADP-glyceromanno-heptose 6-epimerase [Elusimicrobiota bacterium]
MKVILTGAAGFIGSCFLRELNDLGIDDVVAVDVQSAADHPNLTGKKFADYANREELIDRIDRGQLKEADAIVHLGACADTTEKDRAFLARNNVQYSQRLARFALSNEMMFHYASSASVYGDGSKGYADDPEKLVEFKPLNPYAESKWLFDRWVIGEKLLDRVLGYRYFNVFGPNEYHKGNMRSMVSKAFDQIRETGRVKLFASSRPGYADGSEERDFVYVKDVTRLMAWFLQRPDKGGIYNVGTGKARTFHDLVAAVFKALGKPPAIDYFPMPENLRGQYQYYTQADLTRLRRTGCDVEFQVLETSVADYVNGHLAAAQPTY